MRWVCIRYTGGQCEDISTDRTLHTHRHRQTAVSTAWFIRPSDRVHGV